MLRQMPRSDNTTPPIILPTDRTGTTNNTKSTKIKISKRVSETDERRYVEEMPVQPFYISEEEIDELEREMSQIGEQTVQQS